MFFKKDKAILEEIASELKSVVKDIDSNMKLLAEEISKTPDKLIPVVTKDFESSLNDTEDYKTLDIYDKCLNNHKWGKKGEFEIDADTYEKMYDAQVLERIYRKPDYMMAYFLDNKLICKIPEDKK